MGRMNAAHDRWTATRDAAVWAPHGIAALAATHWLDDVEREYDGLRGWWRADGNAAVGRQTPGDVRLQRGEATHLGDLMARAVERDGAIALRAWDPAAASRRGISAIERAAYDPAFHVRGEFAATPRAAERRTVDGRRDDIVYAGAVVFELDGAQLELTVEQEDDGSLFAAFSDATSGTESYRFRFLRLAAPDAAGRVEVDLNRAYLPPCAFSDHYTCAFPPPGNRWAVPITSGELLVR